MHIVFDMYGVIIEESKGCFIPYVYHHFPDMDRERLVHLFNLAGVGEITSDQFIQSLGFLDGRAVTKDYIENHLTFDSAFTTFAEKYKEHFDYAVLSNDVSDWSEYIMNYHDIDKYFVYKIISGATGCRKPDKKIYQVFLEQTGWAACECIFIDNSARNLLAAEDIGMKTILFNRDDEVYNGDIVFSFDELDKLIERKYRNNLM